MIAGYLHPGKPMANMYFVLYSYSKLTSVYLRSVANWLFIQILLHKLFCYSVTLRSHSVCLPRYVAINID